MLFFCFALSIMPYSMLHFLVVASQWFFVVVHFLVLTRTLSLNCIAGVLLKYNTTHYRAET